VTTPELSNAALALRGPHSEQLLAEIQAEFPRFRLKEKQGDRLSAVIAVALKLITLGGQSTYLSKYHTVLGTTLYVSPLWREMSDKERFVLLRHERVHLRQRRRYTSVGMALLYLLPIFPLGLAYGRARLEWEAYCETLAAAAEMWGISAVKDPKFRHQIVERFVSADYGWMWPFPRAVGRWYDLEIARLESGVGQNSTM
jgi:hypothetical protein